MENTGEITKGAVSTLPHPLDKPNNAAQAERDLVTNPPAVAESDQPDIEKIKADAKQAEQDAREAAQQDATLNEQISTIQKELATSDETESNPLQERLTHLLQQQPQTTEEARRTEKVAFKKSLRVTTFLDKFFKDMLKEFTDGFKGIRNDVKAAGTLRKMQKENGQPVTSRWNLLWKAKPSEIRQQIADIEMKKVQPITKPDNTQTIPTKT